VLNLFLFDFLDIECKVLPGISDHDMILAEIHTLYPNTENIPNNGKVKYNFKKANFEEINRLFSDLFLQLTEKDCPVGIKRQQFRDMTLHSLDNFVLSLLSRLKGRPWMTRELLRTIRKRDRAYQAFRQYPTKRNLFYLECLKKAVKAEVDTIKRNFIECHITNELQNNNTKPLYNSY